MLNNVIPIGTTAFNIPPVLTPDGVVAHIYSLADPPPTGVSINGTTVSIATDIGIGEHIIVVKVTETDIN